MAGQVQLTPEKRALIEKCIEDGWPLIQIQRTHAVSWGTLRRRFPSYRGMALHDAAKLGAAARRTTLTLRKTA